MTVTAAGVVESLRTGTTDPHTWSHNAGTASPQGVLVGIMHGTSSTDHVVAVTYGGVAMSRVSRHADTTTEPGAVYWYFLGSNVPTGTQTVSVDLASATTDDIHFVSITLDGADDLEIVGEGGLDANQANPEITVQTQGRTCMSFGVLYSGLSTIASLAASGAATLITTSELAGNFCSVAIRQNTASPSSFALAVVAATDDVAYGVVAVSEVQKITPPVGAIALTGAAPAAQVNSSITPPVGTLTETGVAPTVVATNATEITPPPGALTAAGVASSLDLSIRTRPPGVAPEVLTAGFSDANTTSYITAAVTLPRNTLVLLAVQTSRAAGTPGVVTPTSPSATWAAVGNTLWNPASGGLSRTSLFRTMVAADVTEAITLSVPETHDGAVWHVIAFVNVPTSGSNGADAVLGPTSAADASQAWAATLAVFADPVRNAAFAVLSGDEAAPMIIDAEGSQELSASTTATVTLADDLGSAVGDLLIVGHRAAGAGALTWPANWDVLAADTTADASDDVTGIRYRLDDGSLGATMQITQGLVKSGSVCYRIRRHADPASQPPEISTEVTGNSATPNPGNLTMTGGAKNYLMLFMAGMADPTSGGTLPTGYTIQVSGAPLSPNHCIFMSARRYLNAASEDPPVWTKLSSEPWTAWVIAVHPSGVPAEVITPTAPLVALAQAESAAPARMLWTGWNLGQDLTLGGFFDSFSEWSTLAAEIVAAPLGTTGEMRLVGAAPTLVQGTLITPLVGALTAAGVAPTVGQAAEISPLAGALTVAGTVSVLYVSETRNVPVGALTLTGVAPVVETDTSASITPFVGGLTFTGAAPTVQETSTDTARTPLAGLLRLTTAGAQNVDITPLVGSLAFAGVAPRMDLGLVSAVGTLTLSGVAPAPILGTTVTPTVGALTLTGVASTMGLGLLSTAGALTLVGVAPSPPVGLVVTPTVGNLTLAGVAPTLFAETFVTPSVGALTLAGVAPSPTQGSLLTPTVGNLTLAGVAPSVSQGALVTPTVGSLTLAGQASTLDLGLNLTVGALTLTGAAPSVNESASGNTNVTPIAGALTSVGRAGLLDFGVLSTAGALTLTGVAPTVFVETFVTPSVGALTLAGVAPAAVQGAVITPTVGALSLAGVASTLDLSVITAAGALTLTGAAPATAGDLALTPAVGALTLAGAASTLDLALPGVAGALALSGVAPSLTQDLRLTPTVGSLTFAGVAPTASQGLVVTPSVGAVVFSGASPALTVDTPGSPSLGALTLAGQAPTLAFTLQTVAGALVLAGAAPAVTDSGAGNTNITPLVGTLAVAGQAPSLTFETFLTPTVGSLVAAGVAGRLDFGLITAAGGSALAGVSGRLDLGLVSAVGALTFSGAASPLDLGLVTTAGALALTGDASAVSTGFVVTPTVGALALAGQAASLDLAVVPGVGSVTLTGVAGRLDLGVVPDGGTLVLTGAVPALSLGTQVTPDAGALVFAGAAGRLDLAMTPNGGVLVLVGTVPSVGGLVTVTPGAGALVLTGALPSVVITDASVTAPAGEFIQGSLWSTVQGRTWTDVEAQAGWPSVNA